MLEYKNDNTRLHTDLQNNDRRNSESQTDKNVIKQQSGNKKLNNANSKIDEAESKNRLVKIVSKTNKSISQPLQIKQSKNQSQKGQKLSNSSNNANNHIKKLQKLYTDGPTYSTHQNAVTSTNGKPNNSRFLLPRHSQTYAKSKSINSNTVNYKDTGEKAKINVTKQELYEQNLQLKSLLNQLKLDLNKQKVQTELQKKKNKKFTNKLNREFRKDIYYIANKTDTKIGNNEDQNKNQLTESPQKRMVTDRSNDSSSLKKSPVHNTFYMGFSPSKVKIDGPLHSSQYLIAGLKQKYEKLREDHQKAKKQIQTLKQNDKLQKMEQVLVYSMALEQNNKKLAARLQTTQQKLNAYQSKKEQKPVDQSLYNDAMITQLKEKVDSLKNKNNSLKQENKKIKTKQKENQKTVSYLQSLLIQKSNFKRKSIKTIQKLQRNLAQIQKQLQQSLSDNKIMKNVFLRQMETLNSKYTTQIEQNQKKYYAERSLKIATIKKLQKQVEYLNTIVAYWKPLNAQDQQNGGRDSPVERRTIEKDNENKMSLSAKLNEEGEMTKSNRKVLLGQFEKGDTKFTGKKKTAATKNSENSKKMRKVAFEQIAELPQYIRYRMIGLKLGFQQVNKLFDYKPLQTIQSESSQLQIQKQKWKQTYITQAEIRQVLSQNLFKLKPEQAILLSRYIIEDECQYQNGNKNNGFVYCDDENQIERTIAKSIIKAFIQTYSTELLQTNSNSGENLAQNCRKQWQQILNKNGSRLHTALISIAPHGTISKDKWNDLLKSINIEVTLQVKEWAIGTMLIQSESLSKLKFNTIVKQTE